MRTRRLGLGATMALAGCFRGDGTLGAACERDDDCGGGQRCTHAVCGLCGDGLAQPGELCSVPAAAPEGAPRLGAGTLAAIDLGRDGTTELVGRGDDGVVTLWRGDGAGRFTLATRVLEGGEAGPVRLGELDDDAALDLAVVDAQARTLAVGLGDGAGAWAMGPPLALAGGVVDLGLGRATPGRAAWVAWIDDGGLWQAEVGEGAVLGQPLALEGPRAQWLGDPVVLDDVGGPDLVVVDVDGRRLEPWWSGDAGRLARGEPLALEARAVEVITADVDGDGDADVLVPDDDGGVSVIVSDGEGGLVLAGRVEVPGPARAVVVVDLDRDGDRDLLVAVAHEPALWLLPRREGGYPDPAALPVEGAVGAVAAVDVDRDGLVELLLGPAEGTGALRVVEVEP